MFLEHIYMNIHSYRDFPVFILLPDGNLEERIQRVEEEGGEEVFEDL